MSSAHASSQNADNYGLSEPELTWALHGGRRTYPEPSVPQQRNHLRGQLVMAQGRVRALERQQQNQKQQQPQTAENQRPLDAQFLLGGKFALSVPEQLWATGAAANNTIATTTTTNTPLFRQLANEKQKVNTLQDQINALQAK